MAEAALLRTSEGPPDAAVGLHAVAGDSAPAPSDSSPAAPVDESAPRLEVAEYDLAAALALERELGVSHALAQLLVRRGLADPPTAREFLDARDAHDPSAFAGIDDALELVGHHIRAGSRIVVHGDYDVDGVCATAILVRALGALGADVGWFLPDRIDDGYGVSLETVRRLAGRRTDLLITVDCGITASEEVTAARAAGLDVVVTDHHSPPPDGRLPDCPLVHPALCGYPCPDLCGTGVAFKLATALGAPTADEDIELVALATVTDLMPLLGENRRLVREGLRALAGTAKPGLRALMKVAKVDPSALDARALGFRLGPRINAAGRLRRADAGLELLLTADPQRAAQIAAELDAVNSERRAVEQRILWDAEALVSDAGERNAFVLAAEGWHPGVIGIVASRIVERHHRPAILIALDGEVGSGSGRSIPGFDLLAALDAGAQHLQRYGGHRAAAGLTIARDRIDSFRAAVEAHAGDVLTPELLRPLERVDAVVSGRELGLRLAEELECLEPCGVGNPSARLFVPGARFEDVRPMGEGRHARFSVGSGGTRARAVAFGCDGTLGTPPGEPVDATFHLRRNVWNGAVEAQLVLGRWWPCAPPPIEILGEPDDYLRAVLAEVDARREPGGSDEAARAAGQPSPATPARTVLDRRGESPLAVLADALAAGGGVLAVCADVPRRLTGLAARVGGFSLVSYHALEHAPAPPSTFAHVVALDPPSGGESAAALKAGAGFTHLAWGEAELRFAQQMHELEYGLRTSLVALYRGLRLQGRATGQELERLLRGDGPHGRPARLAGRLIKVLAELELVSLDRNLPALAIEGAAPTALERSPAYRGYAERYEDGRRYLNSPRIRPSG